MRLTKQYCRIAVKKEEETREYKVKGKPPQLDELERFFGWVQALGSMGHSGSANFAVDGDGNARLKFEGITADPPEEKEYSSGSDPEIHFGLE